MEISNKRILVVVCVVAVALIVDTVINQVSDFLAPALTSGFGLMSFITISVTTGIGQLFILEFINRKIKKIRAPAISLKVVRYSTIIIQYFILFFISIIVSEIVLFSMYHTDLLIVVTLLSYMLNTYLLALFSQRLFSWYKSHKISLVVILYAISFSIIVISSIVAIIQDSAGLLAKGDEITRETPVVFPSFTSRTFEILSRIYHSSSDISFGIMWLATALFLHYYRRTLGALKYWIIVSLPLVYYLSTSVDIVGLYVPKTESEQFFFYIYTSLNSTAGGVLFGVAFWLTSRNIPRSSIMKDYMVVTTFGFVLLFISNQVTLVAASYPPFGLLTISFYGLSAYLVFVGLYCTAISVAQDTSFRKSLRRLAFEQAKFLDNIRFSEMENEIERRVLSIAEANSVEMENETGVKRASDEDDIKQYLHDVLTEIKGKKDDPKVSI